MTLPEITKRQNYSLICRKRAAIYCRASASLNTRTKLEWLSLPVAPPQFYTEFHDSAVYCFPRWKYGNLSPAKNAVGGPDYLLLGTIPPAWRQDQRHAAKQHIKAPANVPAPTRTKGIKNNSPNRFSQDISFLTANRATHVTESQKIENISRKSPAPFVSYTLFPAPSPFSSRSCGGEWNQEFSSSLSLLNNLLGNFAYLIAGAA